MTVEDEQVRLLRCIGEPTRLQILKFLAGGEKYVGEIIKALDKEQSLVSYHLRALRECNIVIARQDAQRIYYRLSDTRFASLALTSEAIAKSIILCSPERVSHEEQENQRRRGERQTKKSVIVTHTAAPFPKSK
jgi:ArsR family transcriptional regulator